MTLSQKNFICSQNRKKLVNYITTLAWTSIFQDSKFSGLDTAFLLEYLQSICPFSRQHQFTLKFCIKKEIYVNITVSKEEIFTPYPYFFVYSVMQGVSLANGKQNIILNCSAIWCDKLVMSCESVSFPLFPWGIMSTCLACDMPHTTHQCGRSPAFWNIRLSIILGW